MRKKISSRGGAGHARGPSSRKINMVPNNAKYDPKIKEDPQPDKAEEDVNAENHMGLPNTKNQS